MTSAEVSLIVCSQLTRLAVKVLLDRVLGADELLHRLFERVGDVIQNLRHGRRRNLRKPRKR